jgi:hypothetical protein
LSGGIITSTEFKEAVTCMLSIPRSQRDSISAHCQAIGIDIEE